MRDDFPKPVVETLAKRVGNRCSNPACRKRASGSWEGNDEMDPSQGRGWAVVRGDKPHGMIFFHGGDDSEFVATKKGGK